MGDRSSDSASNYVPTTIQEFLSELSTIRDVSDRSSKLDDILKGLEEEMRKICGFKRELPISILLVKDAITALKEESIRLRGKYAKPLLEQFIPNEVGDDDDHDDDDVVKKEHENKDKKNWLRSAQLWKTDDFSNNGVKTHNPDSRFTTKSNESGFHQFPSNKNKSGSRTLMSLKGYPFFTAAAAAARNEQEDADESISSLSLVMPGTKKYKEQNRPKAVVSRSISSSVPSGSQLNLQAQPLHRQHEQQNGRKQRRCWSQELHRRFLNALNQLGGSHVSTPKQIRELMQVDNLTNDEVKSHLQKYRLHSKKAPDSSMKEPKSNLGESSSSIAIDDQYKVKSLKQSSSQSGSPKGPLDLSGTGGNGNNNSLETGDEISESYSRKNPLHRRSQDDDEKEDDV